MSKDYFSGTGAYYIDISSDEETSLIDEIKSLQNLKPVKMTYTEKEDPSVVISDIVPAKKKKTKPKKKKKSLLNSSCDFGDDDDISTNNKSEQELDEDSLLDVDSILLESRADDDLSMIMKEGKGSYKKLKKDNNDYKKEFAEELTLLYGLLDETGKFGKDLEKDLNALKGSKVRGVSKYTNDLTELILTTKQNKLNILKEITSIKKTIADLKLKAESKNKKDKETGNSPEYLASAYFKNILSHGRNNFINAISNTPNPYDNDNFDNIADQIERVRNSEDDDDEIDYSTILMNRLERDSNPFRSSNGSKYIEYEHAGVKIFVKKCIDTGEWEFIARDKNGRQIYDYPLPTKRDAGRMKFSDDGSYVTDSKGRIYSVIEYYLPADEDY